MISFTFVSEATIKRAPYLLFVDDRPDFKRNQYQIEQDGNLFILLHQSAKVIMYSINTQLTKCSRK